MLIVLAAFAAPATAQTVPAPAPPANQTLLGDMAGLRPWLATAGVKFTLTEISEIIGNPAGGSAQSTDYDGLTEAALQADSQPTLGFGGGSFYISALQYHGRNLSADTLRDLENMSNIQADRGERLWEIWVQQKLPGTIDIRLGAQSIDQEFIVNSNSSIFFSAAFGWPLVPSSDMPAGAPVYPLAALGIRLHATPLPGVALLAGLYNGSPAGADCRGDSQKCNPSGLSFPLDGDQLAIAEIQFTPQHTALPGTYKFGAWIDTEGFADQNTDTHGISLANPASNGIPRTHHGDWSVYALADQLLWQQPNSPTSLNAFARLMGAPADRNPISLSADAGLLLKAPLPGRDNDSAGIGLAYGQVSSALRTLDQQSGSPPRNGETLVEATYQYQATAWCQIQPDLQYVFSPAGTHRLRNEAILGLRTNLTF